MDEFEKQIREITKIRNREAAEATERARSSGEYEYTKFKCWCNAFKNGKGQDSAKVFAEFLKKENINLDFWKKKAIAEKYFNYIYEYNCENDEWIIKKKREVQNG